MAKFVKVATSRLRAAIDRYFQRGSFLRNVATLSSGSAVGNVVLLATTPVISRLYAPETFGVFSVFLSIFTIGSVFATLNLQVALPLPKRDGTAANLLAVSFFTLVVFTLLSVALVLGISGYQHAVPVLRDIEGHSTWLPIAFFCAGANVLLYYWLLRRRDFVTLATVKVGQSSTMAAAQIILGLFGGTATGLIAGHILSQLFGALAFGWRVRARDHHLFRRVTKVRAKNVFKAYGDFVLRYTPGFFISTLSLMLPPILLASMFDVVVAGLYAFTTRAIRGGLALIVQSVTRVAYLRCVELRKSADFSGLISFYLKLCGRLALIGFVPFACLFFFGEEIFALVFGESWRQAGQIAVYLVPGLYAFLVLDHSLHIFVIMDKQNMKFVWEFSRFLMMGAVFVAAYFADLGAMSVVVGLSSVQLFSYLLVFVLSAKIINRARQMQSLEK